MTEKDEEDGYRKGQVDTRLKNLEAQIEKMEAKLKESESSIKKGFIAVFLILLKLAFDTFQGKI